MGITERKLSQFRQYRTEKPDSDATILFKSKETMGGKEYNFSIVVDPALPDVEVKTDKIIPGNYHFILKTSDGIEATYVFVNYKVQPYKDYIKIIKPISDKT